MPVQFSTSVRNARLDAIESTIGTTSVALEIRTGAAPANAGAADAGTLLVSIPLPADWLANAGSGSKTKLGTWAAAAAAAGTAGHFRVKQGATTHIQGTVTASGGGGDMTVDNTNIASGQNVTVNTFTLNEGNA
jgi:hypothetical protein